MTLRERFSIGTSCVAVTRVYTATSGAGAVHVMRQGDLTIPMSPLMLAPKEALQWTER